MNITKKHIPFLYPYSLTRLPQLYSQMNAKLKWEDYAKQSRSIANGALTRRCNFTVLYTEARDYRGSMNEHTLARNPQ